MAKRTNREKLLDFTYKEVKKYGYFEASTTTILKKAKLPKGVMYHYFDSKEQLVLMMIDEILEKRVARFFEIGESKPFDVLIESIRQIFEKRYLSDAALFHRLLVESRDINPTFSRKYLQIYHSIIDNYKSILDQAVQNGEIVKIKVDDTARFITSSIFGILSFQEKSAMDQLANYLETIKGIRQKSGRMKKSKAKKMQIEQGSLF